MAEELTFRLEDFEGPLELLLTLVQKHKMDLHNIPILELIDQYTRAVESAESTDPEISSAFIEMAAHLVVSMGNPHAIVYMNDVDGLEIEKIGPSFENHINFPDRVNTEFVKVIDRHTVQMRVWERGSGETLACGTGACAVAVASILNLVLESWTARP